MVCKAPTRNTVIVVSAALVQRTRAAGEQALWRYKRGAARVAAAPRSGRVRPLISAIETPASSANSAEDRPPATSCTRAEPEPPGASEASVWVPIMPSSAMQRATSSPTTRPAGTTVPRATALRAGS